jgi:hypothetical protein
VEVRTPATRPSSTHHQRRDAALLEDLQRLDGQRQRPDRDRAGGHDVAGGPLEHRLGRGELAAQVAVGDDAGEAAAGVDDGGHPELLAAHLAEHVANTRVGRDPRHGVAGVHQGVRAHQALAERAARVQVREILSRKPRRTSSVIASASPRASAAVVLAVGARLSGRPSS